MDFRPEYWSGQPFPSPGDLPNPGMEPGSPAWQVDSLPAEPQEKFKNTGVCRLSLLQQIFSTQESNQGLMHCRQTLYQLSYQGNPEIHWNMSLTTRLFYDRVATRNDKETKENRNNIIDFIAGCTNGVIRESKSQDLLNSYIYFERKNRKLQNPCHLTWYPESNSEAWPVSLQLSWVVWCICLWDWGYQDIFLLNCHDSM